MAVPDLCGNFEACETPAGVLYVASICQIHCCPWQDADGQSSPRLRRRSVGPTRDFRAEKTGEDFSSVVGWCEWRADGQRQQAHRCGAGVRVQP